ncbi:MAG TPA: hypothetical protein PLJ21_08725, partial [Pseudobdellovibrionaceae bacterium]|nr:hypothetical protein [Pseudobdellovibrionaceae bacterium]
MKKAFFILIMPLLILISIGVALKHSVLPRFESFLQNELENYIYSQTDQKISIETVEIKLFPPQLNLKNSKIETSSNDLSAKEPLKVEIPHLSFQLDFFALIVGRLQIEQILVQKPQIHVLNNSDTPSTLFETDLPIETLFKMLKQIPVLSLNIEGLDLSIDNLPFDSSLQFKSANLFLKNKKDRLILNSVFPEIILLQKSQNKLLLNSEIEISLSPKKLTLEKIILNTTGGRVAISGYQENPQKLFKDTQLNLQISTHLDFEPFAQNLEKFVSMPLKVLGILDFEANLTLKSLQNIVGQTSLKTQGVKLDQFAIGDASIKGNFTENSLNLSEITLEHPSGKLNLTDSFLQLKEGFPFKTTAHIQALDLQNLFQSLNLKKIPVFLEIKGDLPCQGDFFNTFDLSCEGQLKGENFKVKTSVNEKISKRIVEVDQFKATGSFNVDSQGVDYEALVELPKSKIKTTGKILYNEGFSIQYKSNALNLNDISYLSGIDFSGIVNIEGITEGDSYDATLNAKVKTADFQIDKYFLGSFSSSMSFNSPKLYFNEVQGQLFNSNYSSQFEIDLRNDHIQGRFESSNMETSALQRALKGLYDFPLPLSGSGPLQLNFDGPLDFWRLNYSGEANFRSVLIESEYFEKLKVKFSSQNGNLSIEEALLLKNKSSLTASGRILNNKVFDLFFNGQGFQLEESQFINKLSSHIFGTFNFNSTLKGTFDSPEFFFTGSIKNNVLKDRVYEDSQLLLKADKNEIRFETSLFGEALNYKYLFQKNNSPQLKISSQIQHWDYTKFLSLLGNETLFDEYQGFLTLNANLVSEEGDLNHLTGNLTIDEFSIQRNNDLIENQGPAKIQFKNGIISLNNFLLQGGDSKIILSGESFSLSNLNLNLKGKSDLKMTQLFFPFLDDIGGKFLISVGISGPWNQPEMLGSLTLDQSFFKINKFPHPLEKIDSTITFSQKNILINNINGQIAGGTIKGDGNILLKD